MCFHWKSLLRQVRISGDISSISNNEADEYFNSRSYLSRIGAWSSNQSKPMEKSFRWLGGKHIPKPLHNLGRNNLKLVAKEIPNWINAR